MTDDKWSEDVYRELSALIRVYAELERKGPHIFCASCNKTINSTLNEHLTWHMGKEFGWTTTPPPEFS